MELTELVPTLATCQKLAKLCKLKSLFRWKGKWEASVNTTTVCLYVDKVCVFSEIPFDQLEPFGKSWTVCAPTVSELEFKIREFCEKYKTCSPTIVYCYGNTDGFRSYYSPEDEQYPFIGKTMAEAYANVLIHLYNDLESK